MIAIQFSFVLAAVFLILGLSSTLRGVWKDDQWKRHHEGHRDLMKYGLVSVMSFCLATFFHQTEACFAGRYVENWAKTSLQNGVPLRMNDQVGEYANLLNALSALQPDPADHRPHSGNKLSVLLESNGRPLPLFLWKKSTGSNEYSVYVEFSFPTRKVGVGMIQRDAAKIGESWTDQPQE